MAVTLQEVSAGAGAGVTVLAPAARYPPVAGTEDAYAADCDAICRVAARGDGYILLIVGGVVAARADLRSEWTDLGFGCGGLTSLGALDTSPLFVVAAPHTRVYLVVDAKTGADVRWTKIWYMGYTRARLCQYEGYLWYSNTRAAEYFGGCVRIVAASPADRVTIQPPFMPEVAQQRSEHVRSRLRAARNSAALAWCAKETTDSTEALAGFESQTSVESASDERASSGSADGDPASAGSVNGSAPAGAPDISGGSG